MQYYSTNKQSPKTGFKEATIKGQAPDKGLYFPESIPALPKEFIENINQYSNEEIAFKVIQPYVGNTIPENELRRIVNETVNFDIPLIKVNEGIYSLELYHGPTLAFKDIGARFMSRCLGYFVKDLKQTDKLDDTLVMSFSEFGRRVEQNASNGTDHGTANNILIYGGKLKKAGIYNPAPNLATLDNGDLKYEIDFRDVYATLLDKWLDLNNSQVLNKNFTGLGFI